MTRDHVIAAMDGGIPFEIKTADGKSYTVRDRFQISVGRSIAMVFDDNDLPHMLPLPRVTGISYLRPT